MSHEILSPFTDPVACRYNQWGDFSQWRRKGLVHCGFTEDSELITIAAGRGQASLLRFLYDLAVYRGRLYY